MSPALFYCLMGAFFGGLAGFIFSWLAHSRKPCNIYGSIWKCYGTYTFIAVGIIFGFWITMAIIHM